MPIRSGGNRRRAAPPVPPVARSADAVVMLRPCSRTRLPLLLSSNLRSALELTVASLVRLMERQPVGAPDSCARLMR